ncbi:hypothetical protein RFI_31871, partial [Reticulomyxa filosa]
VSHYISYLLIVNTLFCSINLILCKKLQVTICFTYFNTCAFTSHLMHLFKQFAINLKKQLYHKHGKTATKSLSKEKNEFAYFMEYLKHPKHIKYRQIDKQALYNHIFSKGHILGGDFKQIFISLEIHLQYFGFKKEYDDN